MAFFESSKFCTAEEYVRSVDQRALNSELVVDDIYTLMMRLTDPRREAVKYTTRLQSLVHEVGKSVITFSTLDEDLNSLWTCEVPMADGFLYNFGGTVVIDRENQQKITIQQAYFRDYFDDQFGDMLDVSQFAKV